MIQIRKIAKKSADTVFSPSKMIICTKFRAKFQEEIFSDNRGQKNWKNCAR